MSIDLFQKMKVHLSLAPIVANDTASTCTGVDTQGFKSAMCIFSTGVIGAADFDSLAVGESNTDADYVAISGVEWLTTSLPGDTSEGLVYVAYLDLRKRKRYLNWMVNVGAEDSLVCAHIILAGKDESPNTDTERGVTGSSKLV